MKKPAILSMFLIFCTLSIFSQQNDSLFIQKRHVYQNGKRLNKEELKAQLTSSPAGAAEYDKYKTKNTIASTATIVGSGFVLYLGAASLSNSLSDVNSLEEGNVETSDGSNLVFPAIAAVGFVSFGAILSLNARDNLIRAVTIYNASNKTGFKGNQKIEFGFTENGIGLTFRL